MRLNNLIDLMLNDTVVSLNLTYRDRENILTRHSAVRRVKDVRKLFKEYKLPISEFTVTCVSPIVEKDLIMIEIIARRWY